MKKVIIGFSRSINPKSIVSHLIRLFEGTPYSHVFLRWETDEGVDVIYEADQANVRYINYDIFDNEFVQIDGFVAYLNREQYREMLRYTQLNAGKSYDKMQLFGILLARIFGLKHNPLSNGADKHICSENVAYFLEKILGIDVDINIDLASPKDIYELLLEISLNTGEIAPWEID